MSANLRKLIKDELINSFEKFREEIGDTLLKSNLARIGVRRTEIHDESQETDFVLKIQSGKKT